MGFKPRRKHSWKYENPNILISAVTPEVCIRCGLKRKQSVYFSKMLYSTDGEEFVASSDGKVPTCGGHNGR